MCAPLKTCRNQCRIIKNLIMYTFIFYCGKHSFFRNSGRLHSTKYSRRFCQGSMYSFIYKIYVCTTRIYMYTFTCYQYVYVVQINAIYVQVNVNLNVKWLAKYGIVNGFFSVSKGKTCCVASRTCTTVKTI